MSDTQSQMPQPGALHDIGLQQSAAKNPLLIRCKNSSSAREMIPTGRNSSSKTMGLDQPNPDRPTHTREFCFWIPCRFSKRMINAPTDG